MFFDIHSHILPAVDDGAESIEASIKILEELKKQGVTHVMATPHFYPQEDNFEDFFSTVSEAYDKLQKTIENKDLPKIYLGCEMLYCRWATSSELIAHFCLSKSNHILVELTDYDIDNKFFVDIIKLKMSGYNPVIAHPERYKKAPNFRKFLRFIKDIEITVQINADSVLDHAYKNVIKKLVTGNYTVIIGSDSHDCADRAPKIKQALQLISATYGEGYRANIENNTLAVFQNIVKEGMLDV